MNLFGSLCCESDTLLWGRTDSLDELHLSRQLDHVLSSRVLACLLSFVHVETDVVAHAQQC